MKGLMVMFQIIANGPSLYIKESYSRIKWFLFISKIWAMLEMVGESLASNERICVWWTKYMYPNLLIIRRLVIFRLHNWSLYALVFEIIN